MKTFLVLALVLLSLGVAVAQPVPVNRLFSSAAYANAETDTSAVITVNPLGEVKWFASWADSCNITIYVDYRTGSGAWATYTASDSTNNVTAAGSSLGGVLRDANTDNIPGANQIRFRFAGVNSEPNKNGITTATFSAWVYYRF